MVAAELLRRIVRVAHKPPGYVVKRLVQETKMEADRVLAPTLARRVTGGSLAAMAGVRNVDALWERLAARPYPAVTDPKTAACFPALFPDAAKAVVAAADCAVAHEINLLGSGPVRLGRKIDWLCDFVTGDRWPPAFCRSIDYVNKGRPSDVKRPWELSRLQWLLPAGQAYLMTGDESYAEAARDILDQWIAANPYAWTVNWSCTMEPALRMVSWTWLFYAFSRARAWSEPSFRSRFLASLYLHGAFTERHIERSSINGNHLTADAAGLVFAGLFFAGIGNADRWMKEGWQTLDDEISLQVHPDGVDFEASTAYHRLVTELFLLPARYRIAHGLDVSARYQELLVGMARFAATVTRPDGTSPHWGDADDGRTLPLGSQKLSDHRYLAAMVGATFGDDKLLALSSGDGSEAFWHCGKSLLYEEQSENRQSTAFAHGGVYVLADANNHVFIDCGPVGLAGLGGHGHNDTLSFEAWLDGTPLILDPGSYVYTASFEERNAFRSTAFHNTPQVDGKEINRLHSLDNLWNLHDDARAEALHFEVDEQASSFAGRHFGYLRLAEPVIVERQILLRHREGKLTVSDKIEGEGEHTVLIPLHFAHGTELCEDGVGGFVARTGGKIFCIAFKGSAKWTAAIEEARVSPSYGVVLPAKRLVWRVQGTLPATLEVTVTPEPAATNN